MSSSIPTSTSVTESAVIQAPLSQVWHQIKLQDFHHFWTKLSKSEHVQGASPETDVVKWTFEDGTVLDVKLEEHSVGALLSQIQSTNCQITRSTRGLLWIFLALLSLYLSSLCVLAHLPFPLLTYHLQAIDHYITYSVIASSPALTYSSVISTIRCYAVTSGENEGSTFVQWSAHFSSDADAGEYHSTGWKT